MSELVMKCLFLDKKSAKGRFHKAIKLLDFDIHKYAKDGNVAGVTNLLSTGVDVNSPDKHDKYTPLMWAAKNSHNNVMTLLLAQKEILVDKQGGWNESTALIKAVEVNNLEGCQILVDNEANLDLYTKIGTTALMIAAESGYSEIVNLLIAKGADVTLQNKDGYTALVLAVEAGHTDVVKSLCDHGVTKNIKKELEKGIHEKLHWNKSDTFAFVDIPNKFGKNALIMACENNRLECSEMLLEDYHANVDSFRFLIF